MALANYVEEKDLHLHAIKVLELLDGLPVWAAMRVLELAPRFMRTGQRFDIKSPELQAFRQSLESEEWFIG